MKFYLGIVGTAKISKVALANDEGQILANIIAPPLSMRVNHNIKSSLFDTLQYLSNISGIEYGTMLSNIICACFAMSGLYQKGDKAELENILNDIGFKGDFSIVICEDVNASLASNFLSSGGVIVASTGANVYLKGRSDLEVVRVDGWGSLLGDNGSGYDLGSKCLRTLLKMHDGRLSKSDLLEEYVLKHIGLFDVQDLVQWFYNVNSTTNWRSEISDLTYPLVEAAKDGDSCAAAIIAEGAGDLFCSFKVAVGKAMNSDGFEPYNPVKIILDGGLFENCRFYTEYFNKNAPYLNSEKFEINLMYSRYHPVVGALALAISKGIFIDKGNPLVEALQSSAEKNSLVRQNPDWL